jgi:hypothetical protein
VGDPQGEAEAVGNSSAANEAATNKKPTGNEEQQEAGANLGEEEVEDKKGGDPAHDPPQNPEGDPLEGIKVGGNSPQPTTPRNRRSRPGRRKPSAFLFRDFVRMRRTLSR